MAFDTIQDLLTGGTIAGILAIIGLWWKMRYESGQAKQKAEEAKTQAAAVVVDASKAAMEVVTGAMESQKNQIKELSTRVTDQGTQIADLGTRLTDVQKRHEVAITHIAERETWTVQKWANRPDGLPPIPEVLTSEVVKIKPVLADSVIIKTDSRPIARNPPPTT